MPRARAHRTAVPSSIRSNPEIADAHVRITYDLPAVDARSWTPEQWARATFEGAPAPVRWLLLFGFRFILGLRMDRSQPEQVLGWHMDDSRPDTVTLSTTSVLMDAYDVVTTEDDRVVWTTLVRYRHLVSRPIWWPVQLVHYVLMPYILDNAARTRQRDLERAAR